MSVQGATADAGSPKRAPPPVSVAGPVDSKKYYRW
jgi:hypothetical protein